MARHRRYCTDRDHRGTECMGEVQLRTDPDVLAVLVLGDARHGHVEVDGQIRTRAEMDAVLGALGRYRPALGA